MTDERRLERRRFLAGAAAVSAFLGACASRRIGKSGTTGGPGASAPAAAPLAPSSASATAARFVSAGARTKPLVALTFHVSGDRQLAVRMLDLLRLHKVPVTAFMVGTFVDQNPDLMPRFVADGHELANHTYSHLTFGSLSRDQMHTEVVRCRDALTHAAGSGGTFFRPSGTANGVDRPTDAELEVAAGAGYATAVGYDVDPADYADPGAAAVVRRTRDALQPGSIVSLHFGHQGTIDALPDVLAFIRQRGLQPVTASALLDA